MVTMQVLLAVQATEVLLAKLQEAVLVRPWAVQREQHREAQRAQVRLGQPVQTRAAQAALC